MQQAKSGQNLLEFIVYKLGFFSRQNVIVETVIIFCSISVLEKLVQKQ